MSLLAKPRITKHIQSLMKERDRLFKQYCEEKNPQKIQSKLKESKM